MFDLSGSMRDVYNFKREEMKDVFKRSVSLLLEKGHPSNEYFVAGFTSDLQVILDRTSDHNAVIQSLNNLFSIASKGRTPLYDACYLAMNKAFSDSRRKRAFVLFTDGGITPQNTRSTSCRIRSGRRMFCSIQSRFSKGKAHIVR